MNRWFLLIALVTVQCTWSGVLVAQTSDLKVYGSTVFISTKTNVTVGNLQKDAREIGSGFLVSMNNRPWLVTAGHVASTTRFDSDIYFHATNDTAVHRVLLGLTFETNILNWIHHPREDLAILRLGLNGEANRELFKQRFLPTDWIVSEDIAPDRNLILTAVGYPLADTDTAGRFSPITRKSSPASGFLTINSDAKPQITIFFLEDPSIAGFSGGPVVRMAGGQWAGNTLTSKGNPVVYGLVQGTFPDKTGGKMASVTPSKYLIELLNQQRTPN